MLYEEDFSIDYSCVPEECEVTVMDGSAAHRALFEDDRRASVFDMNYATSLDEVPESSDYLLLEPRTEVDLHEGLGGVSERIERGTRELLEEVSDEDYSVLLFTVFTELDGFEPDYQNLEGVWFKGKGNFSDVIDYVIRDAFQE